MQMVLGMHDPAQCALFGKSGCSCFCPLKTVSFSVFFLIFVYITQLSIYLKEHSTDFTHGDKFASHGRGC